MRGFWLSAMFAALVAATPAAAQVQTVDPNEVIDGDLNPQVEQQGAPDDSYAPPANDAPPAYTPAPQTNPGASYPPQPAPAVPEQSQSVEDRIDIAPPSAIPHGAAAARQAATTFERDDLIGAAEGVFGKGAAGLAGIIEDILRDQGEPNAYIAGREASGAFIFGLRYGSGIMHHAIEGQRPVYWTGPSVGFDVGGDAANVFVLVYNLYDSQELYQRFPAAEGRAYFVGGFSASYMRRGDVVLIPVRLGVGWRLGANVGYMKFTEESRWLPF